MTSDDNSSNDETVSSKGSIVGSFTADRVLADATSHRAPGEPALCEGEKIGRYTVQRALGQGGFGTVYLARDDELDRLVAIKMPLAEQFDSAAETIAFIEEARTIARLKHPRIVSVHDVGQQVDKTPFIVMEFVDGPSLKELLEGERLSFERAAEMMSDIAEAVSYAHRQGFVHRDLKPGNVLLDGEGTPHVGDFGLALDEAKQRSRPGEHAGTPAYMAPEQIRGESHRLDGRADIWALGVMLYQLITGHMPFGGDSLQQLSDEILQRAPKPPRQRDEKIPVELERIFLKCCAKQITERYSTATELADELRAWSASNDTKEAIQTQPAGSSRGNYLTIAALVVALIVAGVAVVFVTRNGGDALGVVSNTKEQPKNDESRNHEKPTRTPVDTSPLDGTIEVRVWNPNDERRKGLSLREPAARPLKTNDGVRVDMRLNRPAFVYILWVDSTGSVLPLYPWKPGDWDSRPANESPVERVSLPSTVDEAWPLEGEPGMETLMLLARNTPLPVHVRLENLLGHLQHQPAQQPAALVEFINGHVVTIEPNSFRGPRVFDARQIDDPLLANQRLIKKHLQEHFTYMRSMSFANHVAK